MKLTGYLKKQFVNFVEVYEKHFTDTYWIAFTLTILFAVSGVLLIDFSALDSLTNTKPEGFLDYLFYKHSTEKIYSLTDLIKNCFIFFVSIFCIALMRKDENDELSIFTFFRLIKLRDILILVCCLLVSAIIDYFMVQVLHFRSIEAYSGVYQWVYYLTHLVRLFFPMLFFSVAIMWIAEGRVKLNLNKIGLLFLSIWIINEFSYEFTIFIRDDIVDGILMFVKDPVKRKLFETILSMPLLAGYFLGFYSAFTSFRFFENTNQS
jgi:hypothetical protein